MEVGFSSEDANSAPDFLFADLSGARSGDLMSRPSQLDVTATSPTHDDGDDHVTEVPSLPDLLVIDIPSVMGGLRAGAKLTWSQILYYNLLLHRFVRRPACILLYFKSSLKDNWVRNFEIELKFIAE